MDTDQCDWCKKETSKTFSTQDPDEGLYGPTYLICKDCKEKQEKAILAELAKYGDT